MPLRHSCGASAAAVFGEARALFYYRRIDADALIDSGLSSKCGQFVQS